VKEKRNLTNIARRLRRQSTNAETRLWNGLRGKQLEGCKFRRQAPIGPYVVDFVSFSKRIVIELDGGQHAKEKEKDYKRDKWLESQGFNVLRFWNTEILENTEAVLEVVRQALVSPSLNPSHQGREE
jgi:very-short-patch-repair endonuclease